MNKLTEIYNSDFHAWIQAQIHLLKTGKIDELDIPHLIEELEDMGKSNVRELESRFLILIAHLLKWQFQPDKQNSSWRGTIKEQRIRLLRLIQKVPSLKPEMDNAINSVYSDAVELASDETNLSESTFPEHCPYTIAQLLNKQFYPMD